MHDCSMMGVLRGSTFLTFDYLGTTIRIMICSTFPALDVSADFSAHSIHCDTLLGFGDGSLKSFSLIN